MLAISPFNYPVNLAVSKIAPALIAGNALVLKPPTQVWKSELDVSLWFPAIFTKQGNQNFHLSFTDQVAVAALHMIHCFHLAGFPNGLISCVTGKGSEIGDFLTMHPGVNCIRQ